MKIKTFKKNERLRFFHSTPSQEADHQFSRSEARRIYSVKMRDHHRLAWAERFKAMTINVELP